MNSKASWNWVTVLLIPEKCLIRNVILFGYSRWFFWSSVTNFVRPFLVAQVEMYGHHFQYTTCLNVLACCLYSGLQYMP